MSGTPFFPAFLLIASLVIIVAATQLRHVHPFLALVVVASAFGLSAGLSISLLGKAFGTGFSQGIYSPGLVIVAAGFVAALAENAGASDRLTVAIDRWRRLFGSTRLAALLGLIAGVGASPAAAFAILTPLVPAIGAGTGSKRGSASLALALAISASHGLVLLSPVVIAAAAILDASWARVALFGLPAAVLSAAFGAVWARFWANRQHLAGDAALLPPMRAPKSVAPKPSRGSAIVLLLATLIPLLLLIVQSIGAFPGEPLGGGTSRELVLGVGRPLILFLVGLGIAGIGFWRTSAKLLGDSTSADSSWTGRVLGSVAGIVLTVGAAGGLQRLCQETGMAELIGGERLLTWHVGAAFAVLIPFVIAAAIKTLQGSSLVAAITTAGMVQPIVLSLGLGGESGKALAALAVGAGAMTVAHINDEFFWLAANGAGLSPAQGLTRFTAGTLLQGLVAVAALLLLAALAT